MPSPMALGAQSKEAAASQLMNKSEATSRIQVVEERDPNLMGRRIGFAGIAYSNYQVEVSCMARLLLRLPQKPLEPRALANEAVAVVVNTKR